MAPRNIPKEMLDQLTEEELAGMMDEELTEEGEDDIGEDAAVAAASEGDEENTVADVTDDDEQTNDDDAAAADAQAAAAAGESGTAAAEGEEATSAGAADAEVVDEDDTTPEWVLPIDVKEQIDALKEKRADLAQKFDEGELTAAELRKQQDELEDQLDALKARQMSADIQRASAVSHWGKKVVPDFFKDNPEYSRSAFMRGALDAKVRELQSTSKNPLNPKILERAHAAIRAEILGEDTPSKPAPTPKAPPAKDKSPAAAAAPKRPGMPPTLRDVPQADTMDAGDGGEFGFLDRLMDTDSVAFEKALLKLTDAQRERYMAQG